MNDLFDKCISQLTYDLPFLYKYVFNILTAISENQVQNLQAVFSNYNQYLVFTVEEEECCSAVSRTPGNVISLEWFQKPTCSGRYMNFYSYHISRIKANFVLGLKYRIFHLRHTSLINKNFKYCITQILTQKQWFYILFHSVIECELGQVSQNLMYFLIIMKSFNIDVKIANKTVLTNFSLFCRLKDKIIEKFLSHVLYKVHCNHCENFSDCQEILGQITFPQK